MKTNGTAVYQRQHKHGLTVPQLSAIDLSSGFWCLKSPGPNPASLRW